MLHLLVAATVLAGALLPWALPGSTSEPVLLAALGLLAAVSGLRHVKPPGRGIWFVPTDAFVLAGVATVGGRAACAVALAGLLGMMCGLIGRLAAERIVFNVGAVLLATVASAACFVSVEARPVAYVAASLAFFLVNTGLVAAAVALHRRNAWGATWRATFLPAAPRFAAAALLGAVLVGLATWHPLGVLALGWIPGLSLTTASTLTSRR